MSAFPVMSEIIGFSPYAGMKPTVKISKSRKGIVVAHEKLTESRVKMGSLLAKPRSFLNLPAFLDLNGT